MVTDDIGMRSAEDDDDISVEATEFHPIPAGVYPVRLIGCKKLEQRSAFGGGELLQLQYMVVDGPETDALLDEICSLKGGRGSKLKERLTVLRGAPYKAGETIRPRECIERTAQAVVTIKKVAGDDGEFEVNRVTQLLPWHGPQALGAGTAAPRPIIGSNGEQAPF